jgi:hypothetical protein
LELLLTQLLLLLMLSMNTGGASSALPAADSFSVALSATEVAATLFLASAKRIDLTGGEVEILRYLVLLDSDQQVLILLAKFPYLQKNP